MPFHTLSGSLSQLGSLGHEAVSRLVGAPELAGVLGTERRQKLLRLRIVVLRDENGDPVVGERDLEAAIAETKRVLAREAGVRVVPLDERLVVTSDERAPGAALDAPCTEQGLWRTDLGPAGRYFRHLRARHGLGPGAPVTVFVVRDVVGKCGCSLGPLGDYVTIDPTALRGSAVRILAHELGHSCGLRHSSLPDNLMRPRGQGERLTGWQRKVLRTSRHVTYR